MNIPQLQPPERRRHGKSRLSPLQEVEVWSWHRAKKFIGSFKSKAKELGIPETTLYTIIKRMNRRERDQRRKG